MKVIDILRLKKQNQGLKLVTTTPEERLVDAIEVMQEHDLGSLVVMSQGKVVGMLTFREVIRAIARSGGTLGDTTVWKAMDDGPLICTPETELDEVRRMMLSRHARYLPVVDAQEVLGVISFYDVAKLVVEHQSFENQMLKAYIRDWPSADVAEAA